MDATTVQEQVARVERPSLVRAQVATGPQLEALLERLTWKPESEALEALGQRGPVVTCGWSSAVVACPLLPLEALEAHGEPIPGRVVTPPMQEVALEALLGLRLPMVVQEQRPEV
jgi:hypothetical protein